ncbi:MAG TPA: RNA polymerase sigma-70 factor [Ktedonobacteraceae bacterium]|nr:RNA polymerase sigma-70 factor [Ktedonobacteraceae bacterium]
MNTPENAATIFEQYRILLFSIAYRMLGSVTDAEDIVQETFLRWMLEDTAKVQSPKAFLSTIAVRLCLDQLRSARRQREVYVGPWLPEPIATGQRQELFETAALAESLSFAFLVMLENLGPLERAVFLLREVFEYEYAEIAEIVGKSEANCRQIFHRAQQRLEERRSRFDVSCEQQERITHQFLRASTGGDMQGLLNLLTEDIVFTGDSGGKARVGHRVRGRDKVARGTLVGLRPLLATMQIHIEEVNGQPAITGYVDGRPYGVVFLDIEGEHIRNIYAVMNPDKLRWLGNNKP